jgi:SAM-dependent methyltransferase
VTFDELLPRQPIIARFASGAAAYHHVPVTSSDSEPEATDDYTATNRSTYDRLARRYVENQIRQRTGNEHLLLGQEDAFLASLPDSALVADLGCGPGLDGARFSVEGYRVVGMDLSAGMLSAADNGLVGRLAQADLRALPVGSGRLDGIWCVAALLHIPEQDTVRVLVSSGGPCGVQEASRWSRPWVNRRGLKLFLTLLTSDAGSCIDARIGSECNWRRPASKSVWRIRSLAIGIG